MVDIFLLNAYIRQAKTEETSVSIQLLLLFYAALYKQNGYLIEFQYNSCYCSIQSEALEEMFCSGVSIQLLLLFY